MTDGLEYLGRARMQGLTLLLLAFVVGALAGAAGDRMLTRARPPDGPPPESRAGGEGQRLPKVLEDMDLTGAQRAAIDSILASGRPRNEAIMATVLPRLRAVGDSLHAGIRAVLTPRQAAEFDAYLKTHRPQPPPPRDAGGRELEARPRGKEPPERDAPDRRPPPPPDQGRPDRRPPLPPGQGPPDRRPPPPPGGAPPPPPDSRR